MQQYGIMVRLIAVGFVAFACFIASMLVYGLVEERQSTYEEAKQDIRATWGGAQTLMGPMLVVTLPEEKDAAEPEKRYVLPHALRVESALTPEVRSRGIYRTVVYAETLKVSGVFTAADIGPVPVGTKPVLAVALTDARSIASQVSLTWNGTEVPFDPASTVHYLNGSGMHTSVPYSVANKEYAFSFEFAVNGTDEVRFVPVGKETTVTAASPWQTPAFMGAFLPSEHTLSDEGFSATWRVSSFGRTYPQSWDGVDTVSELSLIDSAFGVNFHESVDLYTQLSRSIKYAVLFIVITFTVFFLFEVLQAVRVHPIQYLLIGAALALFYLLLLSLAEHIGFLYAYLLATGMTTLLITGYSASVLKQKSRALLVGVKLLALYTYLYVVLKLEDYALLFGALLVFVLLASVMYLTRKVDWFSVGK